MRKIVALLIGLFCSGQPVEANPSSNIDAEKGKWLVYDRATAGGLPLVVTAHVGNPETDGLVRQGSLAVVTCVADTEIVNEVRVPQHTDRIYLLEDRIEIDASFSKVRHVASITGDGVRRIVYAYSGPVDFKPILKSVSIPNYLCHVSPWSDRQSLVTLITPTQLEVQLNGDRDVIGNLEKEGDDGVATRKTDFWFYGKKADLSRLAADLASKGFSVDHWVEEPVGVVLKRTMSVNFDIFQTVTPQLVDAANTHSANYDGWETLVVRPKGEREK